jgi:hypothetical protein
MSENRSANPVFTVLKLTAIPTSKAVPSGLVDQVTGKELFRLVPELPGLVVEIVPTMGTITAPAQSFSFPSKKFFLDAKTEFDKQIERKNVLEALTELTDAEKEELVQVKQQVKQNAQNLVSVESALNSTKVYWVDYLLSEGGLPTLDNLWADVFSEVLDLFPSWNEENNLKDKGGIPIEIKCIQWTASLPIQGHKTITARIGVYCGDGEPSIYNITFEDPKSREQRLQNINSLELRLSQLEDQATNLTGDELVVITQNITSIKTEIKNLEAVETQLIDAILSKESVQTSLPSLLAATLKKLKAEVWVGMDLMVALAALQERLNKLLPKPPEPTPE